jgi:hypothetical protein
MSIMYSERTNMRTQLDDLKDKLKDTRYNLAYCKHKGIEGSEMHKYLVNKEQELISYINNIR